MHTDLEQWATDTAAPGEQFGVQCLAQGSHLCRGQFLPEPRFEPTTSGYKSNALSIRPWLPPVRSQDEGTLLWSSSFKAAGGLVWDLNLGPLAPEAEIIPLDQQAIGWPLSVNTIHCALYRCQLKLYHAKQKPHVNMVQKRRRVSKSKSVLWSVESTFDILVGNHGRPVLRAKEEGDLPACHQHSVQKPASLMVWGCISAYGMDGLHVLKGTINAER